jgi:hypothetical protein
LPPLQHITEILIQQRENIITKEEANDTMNNSGNPMSTPNVDVDRLKEYMDSMSKSGHLPPEEVQAVFYSAIKKG